MEKLYNKCGNLEPLKAPVYGPSRVEKWGIDSLYLKAQKRGSIFPHDRYLADTIQK